MKNYDDYNVNKFFKQNKQKLVWKVQTSDLLNYHILKYETTQFYYYYLFLQFVWPHVSQHESLIWAASGS